MFSQELSRLIKSFLQITPQLRPSCDKILEMPSIKKRIELYYPERKHDIEQNILLKTIRLPNNMMYLTDKLPGANYDSNI